VVPAFIDYDNDGWPDIFCVNGTTLEVSKGQSTSHLYHNNMTDLTDVTKKAGVALTGWARSLCWDYAMTVGGLYVTFWGTHTCFITMRQHFHRRNEEVGTVHDDVRWSTGCAFVDYDRDGHLDLFVATT